MYKQIKTTDVSLFTSSKIVRQLIYINTNTIILVYETANNLSLHAAQMQRIKQKYVHVFYFSVYNYNGYRVCSFVSGLMFMKAGRSCYCDDYYSRYGPATCGTPCSGNPLETCGDTL